MLDLVGSFLTQAQFDILIGNLLGDGFLIKHKDCKRTCFRFKQKEESKEYVFWLYKKFRSFCKSRPSQRKDNQQWYFLTKRYKEFNRIRAEFYEEGVKIVPENIEKILTSPLSLAVWYMDDGTLDYRPKNHCSFYFATHCFSVDGAKRLSNVLRKNFSIDSSVYNNLIRGKRYPRIYIGAKGRDRFVELITPYILNCFRYKLPQYR